MRPKRNLKEKIKIRRKRRRRKYNKKKKKGSEFIFYFKPLFVSPQM